MPLDGDGESRLNAFIEWAFLMGVAQARLADYRRVAIDLVEMAGQSRVTDDHILHLIDGIADGPEGKELTALIEEVGEGFLRFQRTRATPQSVPVPLPPASMSSKPVRASTSSSPFVARPEQRVAGELRPPVAVPAPGDVPPPTRISFATGSVPPKAAQPPPPSPLRQSQTHFRCLRCKVMVTADAAGLCPRCGTPAPRVASAPIGTVGPSTPRRWILPTAVAAVLLVALIAFGPPAVDRLRHPSDDAAGVYHSPHLGVHLSFPAAWRHARELDRAPAARLEALAPVFADALSLRSARFFRGGQPSNPEAELFIVVGARASSVTDAALETWGRGAAATPGALAEPVRELTGVPGLSLAHCEVGPSRALHCAGIVSHTRAELYVWGARSTVVLGLFLSSQGPEAVAAEAAELVTGLDPGT